MQLCWWRHSSPHAQPPVLFIHSTRQWAPAIMATATWLWSDWKIGLCCMLCECAAVQRHEWMDLLLILAEMMQFELWPQIDYPSSWEKVRAVDQFMHWIRWLCRHKCVDAPNDLHAFSYIGFSFMHRRTSPITTTEMLISWERAVAVHCLQNGIIASSLWLFAFRMIDRSTWNSTESRIVSFLFNTWSIP